jgi:serine protease Do
MIMQFTGSKARSLVVVAALGAIAGGVLSSSLGVSAQAASPAAAVQVRGLPDFAELAEAVGPSVVNIRTTAKVANHPELGFGQDEQMLEFFRRFGLPAPNMPKPGPRQRRPGPDGEDMPRGVGSGFVLSADGFILTNAHVVDGADEVLVTLTDKREFKARIIGTDKRSDVAVVKIEASGLPAVKLGDVSRLRVGEWVMAIGSPFGLENSVTAGIVSAKQRDTGELVPLIQTDVAINPGNSGGPLINMRGEVVGINSQIYSRSGGYMGISFAIPIDEAARVADQLRSKGHVTRGRLGVQIGPVSKELAESLGLGKAQGAQVAKVEPDTPAEKAGIEPGDIIVKFNGQAIEKSADLPKAVGNTQPGTRSTVTVFRRGVTKDLSITVGEFEADVAKNTQGKGSKEKPGVSAAQALGVKVSDLTEALKKELKVKGGVRVDEVADAASAAGIEVGDVILSVGNVQIANVKEFEAAAAKLDKSKTISVLVRRDDTVRFALIRPPKP